MLLFYYRIESKKLKLEVNFRFFLIFHCFLDVLLKLLYLYLLVEKRINV